jgi:hypothetical protein
MITIKEWMELVDYKITEGSDYGWSCYGPNAYCLDSWNGVHGKGGYSFSIIFSTKTQKVYEVTVSDYTNNRAYRMIAENKRKKHKEESFLRNVDLNEAWDSVEYTDLEVLEDFMEKSRAIKESKDYDTSIVIPLDLPDDLLMLAFKAAHEENITFNAWMNQMLRNFMIKVDKGEITKDDAQRFLEEQA